METKKSIFREHLKKWLALASDKKGRGVFARNIAQIAKVNVKSVPRSFRRIQMTDSDREEKRGRNIRYGPDVTAALSKVWDAASRSCGENLHGQIADYVRILRRDKMWHHSAEATEKLLSMSLGLMKLRIGKFVHIRKMARGKGTTKPGNIKSVIPIRSGPWNEAPTGTMQIDTVAHCGDSIAGSFVYTVNAVDTATLWGARRAQWNKGKEQTVRSMEAMDAGMPFPVHEWHPDSGSEFINWHCKEWAEARGQRLTRSRPNHKNDNCFVEERNGHIVRKWIGYARFDDPAMVGALNHLYDILAPYCNHFIASRRIISKERIGAKWKIAREKKSLTPYQRVMARNDVSDEIKARLKTEHGQLNPLIMKRTIDRRLKVVYDTHKHCGKPNFHE